MSVSPISSNIALALSDMQAASPQNRILRPAGDRGSNGDSDGDSNGDSDANAATAVIRPTVNTRGQIVGTLIDTSA